MLIWSNFKKILWLFALSVFFNACGGQDFSSNLNNPPPPNPNPGPSATPTPTPIPVTQLVYEVRFSGAPGGLSNLPAGSYVQSELGVLENGVSVLSDLNAGLFTFNDPTPIDPGNLPQGNVPPASTNYFAGVISSTSPDHRLAFYIDSTLGWQAVYANPWYGGNAVFQCASSFLILGYAPDQIRVEVTLQNVACQ